MDELNPVSGKYLYRQIEVKQLIGRVELSGVTGSSALPAERCPGKAAGPWEEDVI